MSMDFYDNGLNSQKWTTINPELSLSPGLLKLARFWESRSIIPTKIGCFSALSMWRSTYLMDYVYNKVYNQTNVNFIEPNTCL